MSVMPMQKLSICAHKSNRKAGLETLQQFGAMEIIPDAIDDQELEKMNTSEARAQFERDAELSDQALEILDRYAPGNKAGLAMLQGNEELTSADVRQVALKQGECIKQASSILSFEKAINECRGNILKDENQKEALIPWMSLDVPMTFSGTEKTAAFIGTVSGVYDDAGFSAALLEKDPGLDAVSTKTLFTENDATNITAICLKKDAEKTEAALRALGFSKPAQPAMGIPKQVSEDCDRDIDKQNSEIENLKKKIAAMAPERENLKIVADYYRTRAEKYRVLGTIPQSKQAFFLEGWVPAVQADRISKLLSDRYHAVVEKEEVREDEVEPTVLHNNKFSQCAEGILASYGLPQHGKVDPTTIMSFFYVFFFGMMLSDAAYGIIMAAATFIILRKFPRMKTGTKKMFQLFFWCGLSTVFWGFMFGGFFGNAIDVIAKTFFGYTGATPILKPLWFDPLTHPMVLLIWCMLFGCIHLFTGLGIKGFEELQHHQIWDFICDVLAWYVFLMGLILLLLPSQLFANIAQMTIVFPVWLSQAAKWMSILGAVFIVVTSGRENRNWAIRIALGAYNLYGVTGWLSDVLSYSRLLALGLATGVIASVVNTMGSMLGGGVGGAIFFIVVFLIGHTMNMAINLLGAYVHTNRLQFVEFFGKFYDAGGKTFEPFTTNTKYIEVKEEAKV